MSKKKKTSSEKESCCRCIVEVLAILAVIVISVKAVYHYVDSPKYSEGQCLLNRAFEPVQVAYADSRDYIVNPLKAVQFKNAWVLTRDESQNSYMPSVSNVDQNYIKIPCRSED